MNVELIDEVQKNLKEKPLDNLSSQASQKHIVNDYDSEDLDSDESDCDS
jgi:hypothetical protein